MNAIEKNHTENDLNFNRTVIRVGSRKSEVKIQFNSSINFFD